MTTIIRMILDKLAASDGDSGTGNPMTVLNEPVEKKVAGRVMHCTCRGTDAAYQMPDEEEQDCTCHGGGSYSPKPSGT
jgi:hypothetical protein